MFPDNPENPAPTAAPDFLTETVTLEMSRQIWLTSTRWQFLMSSTDISIPRGIINPGTVELAVIIRNPLYTAIQCFVPCTSKPFTPSEYVEHREKIRGRWIISHS